MGSRLALAPRQALALRHLAGHPGASNRDVAEGAGISDDGQISKLLGRLADLGLAFNSNEGAKPGGAHAWQLTAEGERLARVAERLS